MLSLEDRIAECLKHIKTEADYIEDEDEREEFLQAVMEGVGDL